MERVSFAQRGSFCFLRSCGIIHGKVLTVLHGMFSLKNKKQNRVVFALALFFFASGAFFLAPSTAHADAVDAALVVVKAPLYVVFVLLGWMTSMAVTLFEWAINPDYISGANGIMNKASVYASWKLIRDFFNLFFILTLLYTAFTIIFQVAKDYKKTLLSLVLAALFVNFSFPITRVIIDVTNVPMYYFVNQIAAKEGGQTIFGNFLGASRIQDVLIPKDYSVLWGSTTQLMMAIVMLFIFMVSMLVMAVLMVIRLVALIVLLIFASVGFAASVVPGLEKYGSMWWEKLWHYALFGPAAMLMLFIATRFFGEIANDATRSQFVKIATNNATQGSMDIIASMAMFSVPVIMMWFAIGLGTSMSIMGAGAVSGKGEQFIKWAGKSVTKTPAMWAGRKVDSKLAGSKNFSFLSPGAWKLAIKQRSEEQKHKDEQPIKQTAAKRQDQLNQVISRATGAGASTWGGLKFWKVPGALKTAFTEQGKDHTDHNFAQTQTQSGEYRKEISDVSTQSDYVINEMKAAMATGNTAKADAALQILAKNNDLNDMLTGLSAADVKKYGIEDVKDSDGNIIEKRVDENGKAIVSSENMMLALKGILEASGERNAEVLAKRMMVIGDHATGAGNYAFGGMTRFDQGMNDGHGGFRLARKAGEKDESGNIIKADEQPEWASAKVKNIESQERQRKIHPDSMFTRTADGGFGDINGNVAKEIIKTFTQGDVKNVERSRDDMKAAIYNAFTHMNDLEKDASGNMVPTSKYAGFRTAYNDKNNPIFKDYVDAVKVTKEKKPEDKDKKGGNADGQVTMSSGANGAPIAVPTSAGGGARPRTP